uniref:uncharacterized protein LOC109961566 isoform X2 n=1 Tax=Monopterus albus TaxID=43700 RepID=UPI0009B3037F|nr:uncharacterized protein LOC109961566 isoform X2 [Monopterus albus]
MTLCLYECLSALGLQRHYARFISMGVCHMAHLSALTMEDYPILGIHTMEDRTRLFHLVQMVKTDLESIDDDHYYGADGGDKGYTVVDSSFILDGCRDPDEDVNDNEEDNSAAVNKLNTVPFAKPSCVRRQLDFSSESSDHHHQKLLSHPVGTVHDYARQDRNYCSIQSEVSAIPVQFQLDNASAVVCGCKGNNNHRIHSHPSDHHMRGTTKPDIRGEISMSYTRLSPKHVSFHKPKPRPATVASKRFKSKPIGRKDRKEISRREKLSTGIGCHGASGHTAKPTPVYESKKTAGYNYGLPQSLPRAVNKMQSGEQRITVCVRKRPLTHEESRRGEVDVVATPGEGCVIVHESKEAVDLTQYILQHRFYFDQVFGEESSNDDVYQRTAYPLVQHMLSGGKATCFAYGQTGAGKTHTMLGSSPGRPGLYALAVQDIFSHLSTTHSHSSLLVYVSFFEIYCGQLYDLLDHRKRLFAREDGQKVVHIAGLRDVGVDSVSSLLEVISQGIEERTQGMSGVNPLSSRSHALLQIQLRGPNQKKAGRMWFVDLAGSERASDTKEPDRQSRMEGAEINQSLLALKECIRSLDREQSHTPFRQSKLTQVLKDSFVGDSLTCMIANISPGHLTTEHVLNTLRYADRVKELRGQRGRGKTLHSPKHNSNSSNGSSVGTRGKSPPKKAKLQRQREGLGPTTPTTRLLTGGEILCSTPKNSRWGKETNARGKIGAGLEHVTPVRGWLGTGDNRERRERADERESRGREEEKYYKTESHSVSYKNARVGLVLGQPKDEQLHFWTVKEERLAQESNLSLTQRESVFSHREKESQKYTLKGQRAEERRWIEQQRHVESSRDTCSEEEKPRKRDLQTADESDKERERHLRRYHQKLQQFIPSSASSSINLFSPCTCLSFSSSNHASPSSSFFPYTCSSLQNSSHFSLSSPMRNGLGEVLHAYRASVQVRADDTRGQLLVSSGAISLQNNTSTSYNNINDEDSHDDSSGVDEDRKETEARFGQERGENEKRRSVQATGEGRVRREDRMPAGRERGERRWAWLATTEAEHTDRMTGAMPANVEFYNCDSNNRREVDEDGLHGSDVPADGMRSIEEGGGPDSYSSLSVDSKNDSNKLLNHPPIESPSQRAPAERPFSPACEQTNTVLTPKKLNVSNILPLTLQNTPQAVSSSSHTEKEPWFAANASRRKFLNAQSSTQPLSTSFSEISAEPLNKLSDNLAYTDVHNHTEVEAKMSGVPKDEIDADSLSYIMDPLSISLLEVDQQVATASFLQGEQINTSICLLEKEGGGDNRREVEKQHLTCTHLTYAQMTRKNAEDEDIEFHLSFLELPQTKTHCPPTPDTMLAVNHTEQRKDTCSSTNEHCGIGGKKGHIPEVRLVSLWDQQNTQKPQTMPVSEVLGSKTPASPLKLSTYASMQTSETQSISPSVQQSGYNDSPSSHSQIPNSATQVPLQYVYNMNNKSVSSFSTRQSESILGQCHTVHSNHFRDSNSSLQSNSPMELDGQESTSNQQLVPIIHLSTLDHLDDAQYLSNPFQM